ncbi:MAG: four helix bundle protein [Rhodospirillales bacterium]|nr:four helix bundle protein [Rhodospirillales bacterium]
MQDFRQLKIWRKSHDLTLAVHRATQGFPAAETYGLTSQMRRAAAAIPTNVAEGTGRGSDPDFARFLHIAMGSASELQYLLLLARDLSYVGGDVHASLEDMTVEVKRMLASLLRTVKSPATAANKADS